MIHALVVRNLNKPYTSAFIAGDALEKLFSMSRKPVDHRKDPPLNSFAPSWRLLKIPRRPYAAERQAFRHRERGIDQYAGNAAQLFAVESAHRSR